MEKTVNAFDKIVVRNEKHEAIVRNFAAQFAKMDASLLRPLFTDDVVYQDGPANPIIGLEPFLAEMDRWYRSVPRPPLTIGIQKIAVSLTTVITQREDERATHQSDVNVKIPVGGVFKIRGEKIFYWRDYFDRAEVFRLTQAT